jgi:hypothetical protein
MKLEFEDNDYYLVDDNNDTIATTDKIFLKVDGVVNKLSRENCDEIFGVVDVEKLAEKEYPNGIDGTGRSAEIYRRIYIEGFNKAMEVMGNNKFNDNNIVDAFMAGHLRGMSTDMGEDTTHPICSEYLNSLQQPTEIEVEIRCWIGNGDKESDSFKDPLVTNTGIPKLDENGCLILKKK